MLIILRKNYNCHKSAAYPDTTPCHRSGVMLYEKKYISWKCLNWVENLYINNKKRFPANHIYTFEDMPETMNVKRAVTQ